MAYGLMFGGCLATSSLMVLAESSLSPQAQNAVDRARTKVVALKTSSLAAQGSASAFLVQPDLAITAGHAVSSQHHITAWVNGVSYSARLLAKHPEHDVALIRLSVPKLYLKPLEFAAPTDDLKPGAELIVLASNSQPSDADGNPSQRAPIPASFREWTRVPDTEGRTVTLMALNASVHRGSSGSPILRVEDGRVVGLLSSRELPGADGVSRTAYAIPADAIRDWIEASVSALPPRDFYLFDLTPDR